MKSANNSEPSVQELLNQRHSVWLKSLQNKHHEETRVIQLNPVQGKTAKGLSERELEVLQMVSFGAGTKEIAEKLFLSPHTITNHRKNMLSRSGCGNLSELIRVAINESLL
ncbi:MAG: response regulator transcription factor [Flavobacteriales bacterium]